jgi:hypothetical protein
MTEDKATLHGLADEYGISAERAPGSVERHQQTQGVDGGGLRAAASQLHAHRPQWLEDYGDSHRTARTRRCTGLRAGDRLVRAGFFVVAALPCRIARAPVANWAGRVLAALVYYAVLSPRLALGAAPLLLAFLWSINGVARWSAVPLWGVCLFLFVAAWIGQFIGHAIEGKRPSFFKDLQFLMIGPLWLLADLYRRLGIRV